MSTYWQCDYQLVFNFVNYLDLLLVLYLRLGHWVSVSCFNKYKWKNRNIYRVIDLLSEKLLSCWVFLCMVGDSHGIFFRYVYAYIWCLILLCKNCKHTQKRICPCFTNPWVINFVSSISASVLFLVIWK